MRRPEWTRDWRVVLGVLGGVAAIGVLLETAPRIIEDPPAPRGWTEVDGDPVMLVKGTRYRACVRFGLLNPAKLATLAQLIAGITKAGFVDVLVTEDAPAFWPAVECSRYVEATWGQPDKAFARPSAVELAWRELV